MKSGGCTDIAILDTVRRIAFAKVTKSGSRPQPTTKHNLYEYCTVLYSVSDCGTSTRTIVSDLRNVTKSTREDSCLKAASRVSSLCQGKT